MEDAAVVEYFVAVGDKVQTGDALFEIETDKAAVEVESPADGFVRYILAEPGRTIAVGQPVLILADKDEKIPQSFVDSARPKYIIISEKETAADASVDYSAGPAVQTPSPPEKIKLGSVIALSKAQKITAQRMLASKHTAPCFYLTVTSDVTGLGRLLDKLSEKSSDKISYSDFIIKSAAAALLKFPFMAGRLVEDKIKLPGTINIGFAVSVGDDVVVPVIKNVQQMDIVQISRSRKKLIEKAQDGKLTVSDLEDGCFTVSNLGPFGVESFIPIVIPGQCSILGVGSVVESCIPDNGGVAVAKLMSLTLSVDHRIANGAYASGFLDFLRKTLEEAPNCEERTHSV